MAAKAARYSQGTRVLPFTENRRKLLIERVDIGKIARGDIAVTGAYHLKAKYSRTGMDRGKAS